MIPVKTSMNKTPYLCLVLILLLLFPMSISAQSPYEVNWTKDGLTLGSGIAAGVIGTSLFLAIEPLTIDEINQLSREDVPSFDRGAINNWSPEAADASDYLGLAVAATPAVFALLSDEMRSDFGVLALMYTETMLLSGFIPSIGKGSVQRIRPYVYNPEVPPDRKLDREAKASFPSGHTSVAFSSAVFLSIVYGEYYPDSKWKPYVWGGSLLAASLVGYLRVVSGVHFPTDVLAGAALGGIIGWMIPWMHRRTDAGLSLSPTISPDYYTVSMQYRF